MARTWACIGVLAVGLIGAAHARASSIAYQCGANVCAVDPDRADPPRTLASNVRVAGVTRDGVTAAWVASPPVSIVAAPVAGGAARKVADGATPFWGGATTPPGSGSPNPGGGSTGPGTGTAPGTSTATPAAPRLRSRKALATTLRVTVAPGTTTTRTLRLTR